MKKLISFIILLINILISFAQADVNHDYIHDEQKLASSKISYISNSITSNYDIIYHNIIWEVDPSEYYIKGTVSSHVKALTDNIQSLHFDLIDALKVDSIKSKGIVLNFTHHNNHINITLANTIQKGSIDSVTIYYQGVPDASSGFTAFDTAYHNGTPSLWTLSEPYGAREWWPCKQSLNDKIDSVDIYIIAPKIYKAASNGKLIFEKEYGDKKITYWKHRYPITTYLVAIAVTNYVSHSYYANVDDTNEVEILNYVYPEDKDWAIRDAKKTVKVMEFFSDIFIPYPFYKEKYGHAQFGWGGGMEHQTMSFMRNFSESLITHELAHQWFGNYVTCASWQHIWINEGFAEWCESLAQERFYPDTWNNYKNNEIESVLAKTKSGSIFVDDTTSVSRIFDRFLTYKKGGLILQMMRSQIGDSIFFNGINNYLNDKNIAGGFATANDFKYFIEQAADTNLTDFFNDWYYGQGYPIYNITWNQDMHNKLTITISQITTHNSVTFFKLNIPVLLIGNNKEKLIHLHHLQNNQTFEFTNDFVIEKIEFDPDYNIIAPHPANTKMVINETIGDDNVEIMPNPTTNELIVKAGKNITFNKIDIINTSGKQLFVNMFDNDTHKIEINTSNFPVGIYYIRIDTNSGIVIKRFIKSDNA